MLQKFIDNTFYYLFVFTLIFGVVFYDALGLNFVDELCAIALCGLYAYYVFHTPNWSVNKLFMITLGVFLFYLVYSFAIKCNTKAAILSDFIIQLKPYLAFFTVYAFKPVLNQQMKKNIQLLAIVFSFYLLIVGIISLFDLSVLHVLLTHQSRLATAATIMALLYLYCSNYTLKDKLIFLLLLAVGLLSGRSKMYGFFVLAAFLVFYINNEFRLKINMKNIVIFAFVVAAIIFVVWDKLYFYFVQGGLGDARNMQDYYARAALYYFSIDVFRDYFPLGSGFATYATYTSGEYYSHIYNDLGMDILHGLTKNDPRFIADTYYPALAQFGVIGFFLFFLFWLAIAKKAIKRLHEGCIKNFALSILIILFFLIECTTDATITHNRGLFMMMLLALSFVDSTSNKQLNFKIVRNENSYSK
ncbi:hypothetical protein B5F77_09555 [Parabacteroides sp. An277]|uniref:hypothetical protein n=1 Tax=Parabacteroides sp. An277 TaxID=1965619 RepID=UPI000B392F32|nr:hypothetical protein [Parabacteroides sp. An277]OUO51801.1 hypothetical protein B5F77_09555 [Parabacteroides sp. An277]